MFNHLVQYHEIKPLSFEWLVQQAADMDRQSQFIGDATYVWIGLNPSHLGP